MPDYSQGLIYKLICKDKTVTENYVGSTCGFTDRYDNHKSVCNNPNSTDYNSKKYKFIRETGGWSNWEMVELHKFPCNTLDELRQEERSMYHIVGGHLNTHEPGRNDKEYYKDNKEKITIKHQKYYKDNKEKIKQKQQEYHNENRDAILIKMAKYREENKETLYAKAKVKITCECGSVFSKCKKTRHEKSKKHKSYLLTV